MVETAKIASQFGTLRSCDDGPLDLTRCRGKAKCQEEIHALVELFTPRAVDLGATLLVGDCAPATEGWVASVDSSSPGSATLVPGEAGVRLVAPPDAIGVMLRRPISGPVASRGALVRIELRLSIDDARGLKQALTNASISGAISGRRRTLVSLHASAFQITGTSTLTISFSTTWASRAKACQIELRFRRQAIDCLLRDIEFDVLTLPKSHAGPRLGRPLRDAARFQTAAGGDASRGPPAAAWEIKVADGDGEPPDWCVDATGLRVGFRAGGRPLILRRELPLPTGTTNKLLRIDLRLRCEDAAACQGMISLIAIGCTTEDKKPRSLFRLSPRLAYCDGANDVRLVAEAACLGAMTHCVIEVTLECSCGSLGLESIETVLVARPLGKIPAAGQPEPAGVLPAPQSRGGTAASVTVVGWQLADNAVGRAYVLADMLRASHTTEIVGPLFSANGADLWEPLRSADLPMRSFVAGAMKTFVAQAAAFAADIQCDVAYLSKPRLPAILLALLIHHRTGCGLVLDIDDHELSFFPEAEGVTVATAEARILARDGNPGGAESVPDEGGDEVTVPLPLSAMADEDRPDGSLWTSVAETLIDTFDDRTVSNGALRDRYGGLVVRHARDEATFRPNPVLRERIREEFSIDPGDRVILFMGTPRRHKGLERLAAALHRVDDPRLRLVVIGTIADRAMQRDLLAFPNARISLFPNQPWQRLPELGQIADGVCLLQDPDSPISQFQIPAKLTDALAFGVPVATTRVAPLADTPSPSVVSYIDDDDMLDAWLRTIAAGEADPALAERRIAWFHEELGYRVNRARIEAAIDRCLSRQRVWKPEWTALFSALNRCYDAGLPEEEPAWVDAAVPVCAPAVRRPAAMDLVCFWKQNDTGIYGRRHDMLMRYLRESERVRSLTVFDAPIGAATIEKAAQRGRETVLDQAKLTSDATIRRFLELDDTPGARRRVFIYGDKPGQSFYGRTLDTSEGYADFVAQQVPARTGARRVALAWPVAAHFAELCDTVGFDQVIVDLVDDQRAMTRSAERRLVAEEEYRRTLGHADVIFANCETLRDRFPAFRDAIRVVPNACEMSGEPTLGVPHDIAHLPGPIIGYVGNLRSRIDVPLVEDLAHRHPEWSIVLVGSAHGSPEALRLQALRNVHLLGPRPYEEARRYIRRFDVAIMPHLRNDLSDSMNPLKLYVYVALGKRVVTTRVLNIEELADHVDIADDGPDFLAKVELAVARARFEGADRPLSREILWKFSWQQRVATMLAAIP